MTNMNEDHDHSTQARAQPLASLRDPHTAPASSLKPFYTQPVEEQAGNQAQPRTPPPHPQSFPDAPARGSSVHSSGFVSGTLAERHDVVLNGIRNACFFDPSDFFKILLPRLPDGVDSSQAPSAKEARSSDNPWNAFPDDTQMKEDMLFEAFQIVYDKSVEEAATHTTRSKNFPYVSKPDSPTTKPSYDSGRRQYEITVGGRKFKIMSVIQAHEADTLIGRAARVYELVNDQGKYAILKDVWYDVKRKLEDKIHSAILDDIEDEETKAKHFLIQPGCYEFMEIEGKVDNTDNFIKREGDKMQIKAYRTLFVERPASSVLRSLSFDEESSVCFDQSISDEHKEGGRCVCT